MTANEPDTETALGQTSWTNRLAVLAVGLVWPLIWVGGLVTTFDAGMAVPDWPGTYGYNLFLYPISTWLFGPFDLFIEHGHRLLGAVVGFVSIGLVIAAFREESRRWVKFLAIAILLAVISQGALGGVRVLLSDRTIAMIHGCFGPVVFVMCCLAAAVTSRRWTRREIEETKWPEAKRLGWFVATVAGLAVLFSYTQLALGAQIRHVQPWITPRMFTLLVATHITSAFVLWALTPLLWILVRRCGDLTLSRPSVWLIWFVGVQILLGTGTWVVNYGWPTVLAFLPFGEGFLVRSKGFIDSMIVTAHVAMGSLILATCAVVLLQVFRQRYLAKRAGTQARHSGESLGLPSDRQTSTESPVVASI
ncbi:COX15/CtaA family protein [Roseiconus lacunae]|uniref:COX15/CtaA family protein n=1 Tax=Roseiconus lacunae TaxID=2605694 RepID=UPI001E3FAC6A|nr:COX15/CtaA family protein [Roseiconus lacunae]MCD0458421.1 COX15/CtaA family protein [Roseiconus lacunae]